MHENLSYTEEQIVKFIRENPGCSSKEIHESNWTGKGYASVKRALQLLAAKNLIVISGSGKGTRYRIGPAYEMFISIDPDEYFTREIDEREVKPNFFLNPDIEQLNTVQLFTAEELSLLSTQQELFRENTNKLTRSEFLSEFERLAIDLSWKSSQIEGNTYSLLETERLLKDQQTASGKTRDEATMLLNHKAALNFLLENPDYTSPLSVRVIEDIHSILIQDLGVERNIRNRRVGITGTNYLPLDNEHQIREALETMCGIINSRSSVFEKALMALILISYIQPFTDGNKRTARIICNAILLENSHCPLSFRTVDPLDYKKAMLIFYEMHNISTFKKIFISQFEFAVRTYF